MLAMTPPRSLPAEAAAEKPIAPIAVRALNTKTGENKSDERFTARWSAADLVAGGSRVLLIPGRTLNKDLSDLQDGGLSFDP